jgi:hypothetical protein
VIGSPLPDPRIRISRDLSTQIDRFFAAGKTVKEIPSSVSSESVGSSMERQHAKLRAERDKLAPTLRYLAEEGYDVMQAVAAMGACESRIRLIAKENGIKFGATK